MLTWIKRLLTPPIFAGDEDKTRAALLLHIILLTLLARAVFIRLITWFQPPRPSFFVPFALLLLAMMFLMRRGAVRLASAITVSGFWLSLSAVAVVSGGIHSTGFRNYILPVLIAGLLLGRGAAMATAGLSILVGLVMWMAEIKGLITAPPGPGSALELLITHSISLLMAAVLVTLATRSIEEALRRARREIAERRQAEAAVRKSESRWHAVFDNAAVGIALVNSEGHPIHSNPALQRILGYTEEELCGMSFVEFTHPDDVANDAALFIELFEGKRDHYQIEKRYLRKDGEVRWGNLTVSAIRDGNNQGQFKAQLMIGMVEDITERKRAEGENRKLLHDLGERIKELTALHSTARLLQQENLDVPAMLDELASYLPPAFQYPEVTAARLRLGGTEAVTPGFTDSLPVLSTGFTTADELPGSIEVVYTAKCPPEAEGQFLVEERALIETLADMLRTAHDRRQAEMAQRESEEGFRTLAETVSAGIFIHQGMRYVYVNSTTERLTGYTRDEFLKMDLLDVIHPDFREQVTARVTARERGELVPSPAEIKLLTKGGEARWVEVTSAKIKFHGQSAAIVTTFDITDRKRAEESQLRTQKLEALGTLAGGIAHDFNNILLAISGNTQLAASDLPSDHRAQRSLAEIAKASVRATDLVRRILAFSRPQEQKREVIQLQPVVEEALQLVRATVPTMIELRAHFAADAPAVAADATQLHQIIVNLVTNAGYAIGSRSGLIELRLDATDVNADLANASLGLREGRYVRLSVSDDGCGMDCATMERIFDPFFTTKPPGVGTGLGLSVVHGIMKSHQGAITVYSQLGKGTTFHLYFPVAEDAMTAAGREHGEVWRGRGERVLYVDDEQPLVLLATRTLKRLGYEVTGYTDPAVALREFRARPQDFDLVVTDLSMPRMSGFDLARKMLAARPEVPILITSGYVRPEDRETALEIGIRELILKPNTIEELGRALDRLFRSVERPGKEDTARQ